MHACRPSSHHLKQLEKELQVQKWAFDVNNLPSSLVEHANLVAGTVGVSKQQARSNDVEGGINVHGVWVLEGDDVKSVLFSQVATHPFDTKVVCHL